ncbi:MAG: Rpp14/Pop5 family protein [Candidatus Diapherotrites archaeon]
MNADNKSLKKKTKPIPPTLRGKKRYISFELACATRLQESAVSKALWETMLSLYGSVGTARQKFTLFKWSPAQNRGAVRCALGHEADVKAGILAVKEVGGTPVLPKTIKTSGSVCKV